MVSMGLSLTTIAILFLLALPSIYCSGPHHRHHPQQQDELALGWGSGEDSSEFEMPSEVSRRILASSRYICYEALRRDSTSCSRRGASYYNCRPGAQRNPYSRGCSSITRCRS